MIWVYDVIMSWCYEAMMLWFYDATMLWCYDGYVALCDDLMLILWWCYANFVDLWLVYVNFVTIMWWCWDGFGIFVGSFCDHFWIIVVSFLAWCSYDFVLILCRFCDDLGLILGSILNRFWVIFEALQRPLWDAVVTSFQPQLDPAGQRRAEETPKVVTVRRIGFQMASQRPS